MFARLYFRLLSLVVCFAASVFLALVAIAVCYAPGPLSAARVAGVIALFLCSVAALTGAAYSLVR